MGSRELADLEAKLFDEKKSGCLALILGPRKLGEIDYELHQDGNARMKISLKGAPLTEGTRSVMVVINEVEVAELAVENGRGFLRLETARGDSIPEVKIKDTAAIRSGATRICSGTFHRD